MRNDRKKGRHWSRCAEQFPDCPCCTCAMDNCGEGGEACCDRHNIFCNSGKNCPDYVPEVRE